MDVAFIQETHSNKADAKFWSSQWGSKIYFSHGTNNSRGVAILLGKDTPVVVHNVDSSEDGRYIILYTTFKGHKVAMANIYAPNEDSPEFFRKLFERLNNFQAADFILMAGDMNLAIDSQIDRQGTNINNDRARDRLCLELESLNMVDTWRYLKEDINGFTWRRNNPRAFSRLDYFFVTEHALQYVEDIQIIPGFRTDHSIVSIIWNIDHTKRGPGYWKFNTSLLRDGDYIEKIKNCIKVELDNSRDMTVKTRWEMLKIVLRSTTMQYSKAKSLAKHNLLTALEKKLKSLETQQINNSMSLFTDTDEQVRRVRHDIEELYREKTRGAIIRSRARWAELGEKPTKYFLKLEKSNAQKRTITRLRDPNGLMIYDQKQILKEMKNYYEKLYTSKGYVNLDYLDNIDLPQISQESYEILEDDISEDEIIRAIKAMKNDKCPGTDGFPIEFYKIFWKELSPIYQELIRDIIDSGEFHISARRSLTTLIEKTSKDPLLLKNWRPLSLINVDNKILGKVLANRLQLIAPEVIDHTQAGFIKGRQISGKFDKDP